MCVESETALALAVALAAFPAHAAEDQSNLGVESAPLIADTQADWSGDITDPVRGHGNMFVVLNIRREKLIHGGRNELISGYDVTWDSESDLDMAGDLSGTAPGNNIRAKSAGRLSPSQRCKISFEAAIDPDTGEFQGTYRFSGKCDDLSPPPHGTLDLQPLCDNDCSAPGCSC
jgi:hypothetical protein